MLFSSALLGPEPSSTSLLISSSRSMRGIFRLLLLTDHEIYKYTSLVFNIDRCLFFLPLSSCYGSGGELNTVIRTFTHRLASRELRGSWNLADLHVIPMPRPLWGLWWAAELPTTRAHSHSHSRTQPHQHLTAAAPRSAAAAPSRGRRRAVIVPMERTRYLICISILHRQTSWGCPPQ